MKLIGEWRVKMKDFTIMEKDTPLMHVSFTPDPVIKKYDVEEWRLPFHFIPDRGQMFQFLLGRSFERARPDCDELLNYLGLETYNPYEIVQKTHGVCPDDYWWLKFDGEEINWSDVNVYKRV
jgi:hypothetical protein